MNHNNSKNKICETMQNYIPWTPIAVPKDIPHGDMPGDKVEINDDHINKANKIFAELLDKTQIYFKSNPSSKIVISVYGGSGVGKSEIASLLSYYFNQIGIGSYTLSGDNYPRRIPHYNDAERVRIFRQSAIRGLITHGKYTSERFQIIRELQQTDRDASRAMVDRYSWLEVYQQEGNKGLKDYLGTEHETDFSEISNIVSDFKNGVDKVYLKRMGREVTELWYEKVDFQNINVLVIEWTHGNNDRLAGVDIPIFLNSTPQETLEHRKSRNRDGALDSPFTAMVLEIEQELLDSQAKRAKMILSKNGELLNYSEYRLLMANLEV